MEPGGITQIECDVLIVGASLGGTAAALRAAEMGADTWLIESTGWIGGQLTSQGVCTPDENRWVEAGGGTASYRAFRERVRTHYRTQFRLAARGREQNRLNPGSCWVSRLSMEPLAARAILEEALADLPALTVRTQIRVVAVETEGDRIATVEAVDSAGGERLRITARYFLDATELGDLLPEAGVEFVLGAESRGETGEPDAPEQARPDWIQPFTLPIALELRPAGEDHTIPRPAYYEEMKELQKFHILDGAMKGMFGDLGWWTYRRILAAENFDDPAIPCDVAMINTGSNDFRGGVIPAGSSDFDRETIQRARSASAGYIYWLQTECPRADGPGIGYPEFRPRGDLFDTDDGIAPAPYIRESRRIRAVKSVLQQEIVCRDSGGRQQQAGPRAAHYPDSVGIGHYWLDIHDGGTDEPNRFLETMPFQIPLGALIPIRVVNLLPACKNLGVTHLTNGAYRLHPIEWNVGESAGALAAFCCTVGHAPRQVRETPALLRAFQYALLEAGIPLYWWGDLPAEHPAFPAAQRLAMDGIWPGEEDVEFRPDDVLTDALRAEIESNLGRAIQWPADPLTRSEAALWLADQIRD